MFYGRNGLDTLNKGLNSFIKLCARCHDEKMLLSLFDLFFTEEEKNDLSLRYLIVHNLLKNKQVQREIAKNLKVSIAKVTRGSNALKPIDKKLLTYLKDNL